MPLRKYKKKREKLNIKIIFHSLTWVLVCVSWQPHPSTQDLIDGCTLFQRAFCHYFGPHLLHVQHECVQRLLYVRLFLFILLFLVLMFPVGLKQMFLRERMREGWHWWQDGSSVKNAVCMFVCVYVCCFRTHELLSVLMSLWEDSCLTLGVTMAGCGMPVVCKLWWGGTMWGGNLEEKRLCKSSEWSWVKWGQIHTYTHAQWI